MRELQDLRKSVDARLRAIPFVKEAISGHADVNAYERYLTQVAQQYAPHSPVVMALAASRCMNTHRELATYLLRHAIEERDHNEWAVDDLGNFSARQLPPQAPPVTACSAMIAYTYYTAGTANPIGLFGWMYILEAVGADLGPDAANGLSQSQLPDQFVKGHSVADQVHTQEIFAQIVTHVITGHDQSAVIEVARVSADLYVRMFEQVQELLDDAGGPS